MQTIEQAFAAMTTATTAAYREEDGWLIDADNNRAQISYWGTKASAKASLASLKNCNNCLNCSGCSGCTDCSLCTGCTGLYNQKNLAPVQSDKPAFVVPVVPNLHQAVLAAASVEGSLDMSSWHCGTSCCRAGHIVHAAGPEGYALEEKTSTAFAAMQIAKASGLPVAPPRFYESNEVAMADMHRMAALEAVQVAS